MISWMTRYNETVAAFRPANGLAMDEATSGELLLLLLFFVPPSLGFVAR